MRSTITPMCFGRSVAVANRGSRGSSGWPIIVQSRSNRCCRRREHDPLPLERPKCAARPARVLELTALADDALPAVERGRVFHDAEGRLVERGVDPLAFTDRVAVA